MRTAHALRSILVFQTRAKAHSAPATGRGLGARGSGRHRLSRDQELDLAARVAAGDEEARNQLVQANLRLVIKIAREFQGRGLELDDLIGEGNLGLLRAIERFDCRFGNRFSTYAVYWIKEAIRRALVNTSATIRIPADTHALLSKWWRVERTTASPLGRSPSFDDLAAIMGLSEAQKVRVADARRACRIRRESSRRDEAAGWLLDEVDDRCPPTDAILEADEERAIMAERMRRLDAREQVVLRLRFGLDGERLTLAEIGRRLGLCRVWVHQIEIRAIRKLGSPPPGASSRHSR
jgi:RNA polymerase primary sigma factor